ncbi:MAG: efflux RND transporter periplasmic adaptor subunit [Simkania sp.]|nr:efflux RND transporter periplasmic adaptor subunit [Simkania sp.]
MKKNHTILLTLLTFCACNSAPPHNPPPVAVATSKALQCDVPLYYDYVGHVEPFNTVQIVPQVQGFLTKILFQQGQPVKQNDLLCTIDARPYEATLAQAEATLSQTIAALRLSQDTVERYAKLVQNDFVSQLDFDNYVTNVLSNEAVIKQNLAEIEAAKLNVDYCYLKAPMNAIAGVKLVDEGNFIPAGSSQAIVILNQIQPIYVNFYAPEEDLSKIRPLQAESNLKAHVYLEGDQKHCHKGELTLINNEVNEATGSILLEVTLPNEDQALWPGQFVSIRLFLQELKGAIVVPTEAVGVDQNGHFVYVIKEDMTAELRSIKKGASLGEQVVVSSGLCEGESVVVQGQVNLLPGAAVVVNNSLMTRPTFDNGLTAP